MSEWSPHSVCQTNKSLQVWNSTQAKSKRKSTTPFFSTKAKGSVPKIKTQRRAPKGFASPVSACHKWHKHLFPYFHFVSFKFPLCVLEMNIWSFPPWTCHRWAFEAARQRIVFVTLRDIQQREIKPRRGGGRTWNGKHCVLALFTCLETLFVSNVLTTNVSGQQRRTIFTFLEMIACFNVFSFFPLSWILLWIAEREILSLQNLCIFLSVLLTFLLLFQKHYFALLWRVCMCMCMCVDGNTGGLHSSNIWNSPTCMGSNGGKRYMGSHCFPINTSPALTGR